MTGPTLIQIYWRRYHHRYHTCYRCHKDFVEGDEVYSKNCGKHHRKLYHKTCWEGMLI